MWAPTVQKSLAGVYRMLAANDASSLLSLICHGNMAVDILPLHPFNHETQPVMACVEIGTVDLIGVSGKNDLRISPALPTWTMREKGEKFIDNERSL